MIAVEHFHRLLLLFSVACSQSRFMTRLPDQKKPALNKSAKE